MKKLTVILIALVLAVQMPVLAQLDLTYQTPPKELAAIVDAPATPSTSLNVKAGLMLLMDRPGYPDIHNISKEMLRLGGMRIDPATNGSSRASYYTGVKILDLNSGEETPITGLPQPTKITNISWSPNDDGFVFIHMRSTGMDLWYVSLEDLKPRRLAGPINGLMGSSVTWMPDGKSLICKLVPANRGGRPIASNKPTGPIVSENLGKEAAVRTYQDLLKNKSDEALFEYFVTSKLVNVDLNGKVNDIARSGLYRSVSPSPDGNYLLVAKMTKPFSYLVPYYSFPYDLEMWDASGEKLKTVHQFPLMESIPKGSGSTQPGPRGYGWRSDVPATIVWTVALDKGDPKVKVPFRDQVYFLDAPFNGEAMGLLKTRLRFGRIIWGRADLAVVSESWRSSRQSITSFFNPSAPDQSHEVIWDRSSEDRYSNPGRFLTDENEFGRNVLFFGNKGKTLYLTGTGASPEGNRPFLDEFTVKNHETERLWRSEAPYYESVVKVYDVKSFLMVTSRQSKTDPPNYFIRNLKKKSLKQITYFENTYPFMKDVKKELITYMRDDGVLLSATLYTPAGWTKADGPLPTLLWAYPREFKSKAAASQISSSPYLFTRLSPTAAIPFVTQGYAIIDGASFPIIGEGESEPNDFFVEQLVANGKAAIDKAAEMGVTDPARVGVGGHSYGAFMTANLLAHCDYFAAGIARSGAYNRTLTPFGFQSEPRTYWEAPEIYFNMSPFMHANKVNEPLLLIHGIADNNSGTFPIQSERFYNALKGHGAIARLVMLPLESHGYIARESLKHMLWEQSRWLDKYVKNKK